jgi:hypothetical protein
VKSACFDDPTLVSTAGLVPVMALAQRAGLAGLVEAHVSVPGPAGAHAGAKIGAVVAGMVAGADSFEDLAVLRHGAMGRLLPGAPDRRPRTRVRTGPRIRARPRSSPRRTGYC